MIKRPSKSEIRATLDDQIHAFLNDGGKIQEYDQGDSSLVDGRYDRNQFVHGLPKQLRTPIPKTLKVIDHRRSNHNVTPIKRKLTRVKKIIYDDFGEPLREVWVEQ